MHKLDFENYHKVGQHQQRKGFQKIQVSTAKEYDYFKFNQIYTLTFCHNQPVQQFENF